ncbi:hypothetical protein Cgig2_013347 [Carnegiea gigantea]|uniref:Uncharacterized protein n=1 Tax=Carnegiea gigantea TaxID=171969 RepID=A0A9Q1GLA2_9CARY|nr:hypothetical protein Cgig2_013347 [Carnegiea gigantea]
MKRSIIAKVLKMKVKLKIKCHILLTISIGCFHQAFSQDDQKATDLTITNIRLLVEVTPELENLIPGASTPLKRVRKVAVESMSDALTRDRHKRSKSRTPILLQDSFSLGVSQEEKEALPEGVVIVDSQLGNLVAAVQVINYDVEDVVMRYMTTSAQCISTPLMLGTSSHSYIPLKSSEEVPPEKKVDDKEKTDKSAERATEKATPEKPIENRSKKTKAGKEKCEETVSKKAKRDNSSQQAKEEMEENSSVEKVKEKKKGKTQNAAEKAPSTHPETETSSNKPQQEE